MLYHCVGGDVSDVINKTDCINKGPPFRWVNCKYNFDDLGQVSRLRPGRHLGKVTVCHCSVFPKRKRNYSRFTVILIDFSAEENI